MRSPSAIVQDIRALADELEQALNAPPKPRRRARAPSQAKKPAIEVTDDQRAKARRLLRDRGLLP
ncbi:MAG: hypothetical protein ABI548_01605 [Polyangiaceae bacterium]